MKLLSLLFFSCSLFISTVSAQIDSITILQQASDSLWNDNNYQATITQTKRLLNLLEGQSKDSLNIAEAAIRIGECYYKLDLSEYAITFFEKGIQILKDREDRDHTAYFVARAKLGESYRLNRSNVKGEQIQRNNLEDCANQLGEKHSICIYCKYSFAKALTFQGKTEEAESLYSDVLAYYEESENTKNVQYASLMESIGINHIFRGNWFAAEPYLQKCLEIRRAILPENDYSIITILSNIVAYYNEVGNYQLALIYNLELSALFEKNPHLIETESWFAAKVNLISNYILLQDYTAAEEVVDMLLPVGIKTSGKESKRYLHLLLLKAEIESQLENLEMAKVAFEEYMRLIPKVSDQNYDWGQLLVRALKGHGYVLTSLGDFDKAENLYFQALEYAGKEKIWKEDQQAMILKHLVHLYTIQGKNEKAIATAKKIFKLNEKKIASEYYYLTEKEKENFARRVLSQDIFFTLLSQCHQDRTDYLIDLLNQRLLSKGLNLKSTQYIREQIAESQDTLLLATFENWNEKRREYGKQLSRGISSEALGNLKEKIVQLERQLTVRSSQFRGIQQQEVVRWEDVNRAMKIGEAAIEVVRFEDSEASVQYAFFIIRPDKEYPDLVLAPDAKLMENEFFERYIFEVTDDNPNSPVSSDAFVTYWQFLEPHLNNIDQVYFAPDGIYHKISLNSLSPADGDFLIDQYQFHILNSPRDLIDRHELRGTIPKKTAPAVLVGNPDFGYSYSDEDKPLESGASRSFLTSREMVDLNSKIKLDPLPYTQKEIEMVDSLLKKNNYRSITYLGKEASEENIKNTTNPFLLHIATHGYFMQNLDRKPFEMAQGTLAQNPLFRSMLFLSGAEQILQMKNLPVQKEDGILNAYEVMNMQLNNTQLVVLSSCQSGLGKVENGEGVYGLQRAFRIAGVHYLLLSLWEVEDKATSELMTVFYEQWLSGKNIYEAFQLAQQKLREKYTKPFYWAGFTLVE